MKNIAIYGAGGFGKEIALLIKRLNDSGEDWNLIGFFDDGKDKGSRVSHYGFVLGDMTDLNAWTEKLAIVIAIGNTNYLSKVKQGICNCNIWYPNIIDPSVKIVDPETFVIGEGNIIQQGCRFSCDIKIGSFNVFNSDIVAGHDVSIGNYNSSFAS